MTTILRAGGRRRRADRATPWSAAARAGARWRRARRSGTATGRASRCRSRRPRSGRAGTRRPGSRRCRRSATACRRRRCTARFAWPPNRSCRAPRRWPTGSSGRQASSSQRAPTSVSARPWIRPCSRYGRAERLVVAQVAVVAEGVAAGRVVERLRVGERQRRELRRPAQVDERAGRLDRADPLATGVVARRPGRRGRRRDAPSRSVHAAPQPKPAIPNRSSLSVNGHSSSSRNGSAARAT